MPIQQPEVALPLMNSRAMHVATARAERLLQQQTGIASQHSRDLAIELAFTFAIAAVTDEQERGGRQ